MFTISFYRMKSELTCCVELASTLSDTIPTCCPRVPRPSFQPSKHRAGSREKGDREIEMTLQWVASVHFPPHQTHWELFLSHIKARVLKLGEGECNNSPRYIWKLPANPGFPKHMLPTFPTQSKYPGLPVPQTPHLETGHWDSKLHIQEARRPVGLW